MWQQMSAVLSTAQSLVFCWGCSPQVWGHGGERWIPGPGKAAGCGVQARKGQERQEGEEELQKGKAEGDGCLRRPGLRCRTVTCGSAGFVPLLPTVAEEHHNSDMERNGFPEHAESMGRSSSTCPRATEGGGRETACLGVSESQQDKPLLLHHGRGRSRVGCKPGAEAMLGWGTGQGEEPSQSQLSLDGNHKASTGFPGSCFPLQD